MSIHYSRKINLIFYCLLFLLPSCRHIQPVVKSVQETQGIKGTINFMEGTFLLSGEIDSSGREYEVEREIYIYELTSLQEVDMAENGFVKAVFSKLIKTEKSNEQGKFKANLEPGTYSLFINENNRLYSKIAGDGENYAPVVVEKGKFTQVIFNIDYLANYRK